jgi:hypothetical protein
MLHNKITDFTVRSGSATSLRATWLPGASHVSRHPYASHVTHQTHTSHGTDEQFEHFWVRLNEQRGTTAYYCKGHGRDPIKVVKMACVE